MRVGSKKSENLERSRGVAQRKSELSSIIKDGRKDGRNGPVVWCDFAKQFILRQRCEKAPD